MKTLFAAVIGLVALSVSSAAFADYDIARSKKDCPMGGKEAVVASIVDNPNYDNRPTVTAVTVPDGKAVEVYSSHMTAKDDLLTVLRAAWVTGARIKVGEATPQGYDTPMKWVTVAWGGSIVCWGEGPGTLAAATHRPYVKSRPSLVSVGAPLR